MIGHGIGINGFFPHRETLSPPTFEECIPSKEDQLRHIAQATWKYDHSPQPKSPYPPDYKDCIPSKEAQEANLAECTKEYDRRKREGTLY